MFELPPVPDRLALNKYEPDELSHIEIDQAAMVASGAGPLIVRMCPTHVYALRPDGTLAATYEACGECGTCIAVAPEGTLRWHYPRGGFGVVYREG